jgi:hypothetical protein
VTQKIVRFRLIDSVLNLELASKQSSSEGGSSEGFYKHPACRNWAVEISKLSECERSVLVTVHIVLYFLAVANAHKNYFALKKIYKNF